MRHRVPVLLLFACFLTAANARAAGLAAGIEIEAASSFINTLHDLGVLPRAFRATETTGSITLSATRSLTEPAGTVRVEFTEGEAHTLSARSGSATAEFSIQGDSVRVRSLLAGLHGVTGDLFGFRVSSATTDLLGSAEFRRGEAPSLSFRNLHESMPDVVIEATPMRLALHGVKFRFPYLDSTFTAAGAESIRDASCLLTINSWTLNHPAFGTVSGNLTAETTVEDGILTLRKLSGRLTAPLDGVLSGSGTLDLARLTGDFTAGLFLAETLHLDLAGDLDFNRPVTVNATGELRIDDIESLWPAVAPYAGGNASQWLAGGHVEGTLSATYESGVSGPGIRGTLSLDATRLKGLSPDSSIGWQGGRFVFDATAGLDPGGPSLTVASTLTPGQVLIGEAFMDFRGKPLVFRLDAHPQPGRVQTGPVALESSLSIADSGLLLSASGGASIAGGTPALHVRVKTGFVDLARLYASLAPSVLADRAENFSLDGRGAVAGNLTVRPGRFLEGTTGPVWVFDGTAALDSLSASAGSSFSVTGLDMFLPVEIGTGYPAVWHIASATRAPAIPGSASIRSASLGSFTLPAFSFRPVICENRFRLADRVRLDLLGGEFLLDGLTVESVLAPEPRVLASARLESLDVETVCRALGLPPLPGRATLRLPDVAFEKGNLTLSGETRLEIFDGEVRVQDLRVAGLLGSTPLLGFSTEFNGLNLGEITSVIPVGRMEGGIRGHAKHFQLFLNPVEPYAFDLLVESDPHTDYRRLISIEAVRTLVNVGEAGKNPFPWWFNWFDRFKYARLGMHLRLENDVIWMEGLIKKHGQPYFLYGSGTARINLLAPPSETGWRYSEVTRRIEAQIRQIRQQGMEGVTIR